MFWCFCCLLLLFQVPSHCRFFSDSKYDDHNNEVQRKMENKNAMNDDPEKYLVYPRVYRMSKRRRRGVNEDLGDKRPELLVLRTRNETFYIELEPSFSLNEIPVHIREDNGDVLAPESYSTDCLKTGKILNHPEAVAAISTCEDDGTMTGILLMKSKAYILKPAPVDEFEVVNGSDNELTGSETLPPYILLQYKESLNFCAVDHHSDSYLALGGNWPFTSETGADRSASNSPNIERVKRADTNNRKVMEVAVFADSELYARIEATSDVNPRQATVRRVLGIMNQVQLIYNYASMDIKLKLVIVKLEVFRGNVSAPDKENGNIDDYLENFCNWQSKMNTREGKAGHWDHAIMLTGLDLYKEDGSHKNSKVLGLAWVNGMCRSNYSCTLNEGTNFEAAFVIAHEMGHSLGIMHDGTGNNCDRNKYIMSDKTGPGKVNWSLCSNAYMKKFFRSGYGWCLDDDASPPNRSYDLQSQDLPGMRYSLEDQCHLAVGMDYSPHQSNKEPFNNVCRELWCAVGSWAKPAHPALDGSPCGSGKHCREGSCKRERKVEGRRMGVIAPSAPPTRRAVRWILAKDRDRYGDPFTWIDRTVLRMIRQFG